MGKGRIMIGLCLIQNLIFLAMGSSYDKAGWFHAPTPVTAGNTCHSYENYIMGNSKGGLIYWIKQEDHKYYYSKKHKSQIISIQCSKYGGEADGHLAVLDQNGNVSVWKEGVGLVAGTYIEQQAFTYPYHAEKISLSMNYLGVGNETHISIYHLSNLQIKTTLKITGNVTSFILNDRDQLIVSAKNSFIYVFPPPYNKITHTISLVPLATTIDYYREGDSSHVLFYCPSNPNNIIYEYILNKEGVFSELTIKQEVKGWAKYCAGTISQIDGNTFSNPDFDKFNLDNPIQDFICVTSTNSLVESMVYLISAKTTSETYVDCYQYLNPILSWTITIVSFCCACCCSCLKNSTGGNCDGICRCLPELCRAIGKLLKLLFENLIWLPTRSSIEQVRVAFSN